MIKYESYFKSTDDIAKYKAKLLNEMQNNDVGFYNLPNEYNESELIKCQNKFPHKTHFVIIGMGGSSVGTRAISSFLGLNNIDYLDNISTPLFNKILKKINLKSTLFILVSKSGNTIESISYFRILLDVLGLGVDELKEHMIGICMKNTVFYEFLMTNQITHFNLEENVSGRFSVFSNVGIVPLYLAGANTKELLNGALACKNDDEINSQIIKKAYTLTNKYLNKNYVLFTYCEELRDFNEWFVQLVAESLGKTKDNVRLGISPTSIIGPKDQHSYLQLIIEGPKDKFVDFIRLIPSKSYEIKQIKGLENLEAQSIGHSLDELLYAQSKSCLDAIKAEGIDVAMLELDGVSAYDIGFLMYYYELLVANCGLFMGINTYNQPGVESAKKLLKVLLTSK